MHPQHMERLQRSARVDERQLNDQYLKEVKEIEATQCCYWACEQPNAPNLSKCAGCHIVKYCCKEHQAKDWAWEHKGECKRPTYLKEEYEDAGRRNLAGDYTDYRYD